MKSTQWDSSWPKYVSSERRRELLNFWETRFGVPPALFTPFEMAASSRVTYLIKRSPFLSGLASLRVVRAGIPFMRNSGLYLKPTTDAIQLFGYMANKNTVSLNMDQIHSMCLNGEITLRLPFTSGFIIIKEDDYCWGCGLFLEPDRLLCRFPKNIKKELERLKDAQHPSST